MMSKRCTQVRASAARLPYLYDDKALHAGMSECSKTSKMRSCGACAPAQTSDARSFPPPPRSLYLLLPPPPSRRKMWKGRGEGEGKVRVRMVAGRERGSAMVVEVRERCNDRGGMLWSSSSLPAVNPSLSRSLLSLALSVSLRSVCLSACLPVSLFLSLCRSVCHSAWLPVYLSAFPSFRLSPWLPLLVSSPSLPLALLFPPSLPPPLCPPPTGPVSVTLAQFLSRCLFCPPSSSPPFNKPSSTTTPPTPPPRVPYQARDPIVTPVDLPWPNFNDHLLVLGLSFIEGSVLTVDLQSSMLTLDAGPAGSKGRR
jgi:hypothetical protein